MCGHVGMAGVLAYQDEATMKRLLLLDYARGPDSTGLAAVKKDGSVSVVKVGSHPLDLFDMTRFKSALSGSTSKVFMGHNRAATRGAISSYNAHPYELDNIVGAHNGTLEQASVLAFDKMLDIKHPVDSMAIFEGIDRFGLAETAKNLKGAWALVWYDKTDGSLNFLRNKERPMYYGWTKDFKILFWASEWEMLESAIKMSGKKYEMYVERGTGYQFFPMAEDTHYKFDVQAIIDGDGHKPKPKIKVVKGREAPPVKAADPFSRTTGLPGVGTWDNGVWRPTPARDSTGDSTTTTSSVTQFPSKGKDVIHILGTALDPFGGAVLEEDFNKMAHWGCSWCTKPVKWGDTGLVISERHDSILCGKCSCKPHANRVYTDKYDLFIPTPTPANSV